MKTLEEIKSIRDKMQNQVGLRPAGSKTRVVVGLATCGIASGAKPVFDTIKKAVADKGLDIEVAMTGCIGLCQYEPIVEVMEPGKEKVTYVKMTPEKAIEVVDKHFAGGDVVNEYTVGSIKEGCKSLNDTTFYNKQFRIALRNCGVINPEDIDEYIARDGYQALGKVLTSMTPDDVVNTVLESGLRGRGGGGFPTGRKWQLAKDLVKGGQKYVCCNADEGDPGAFMDRSVLEGDPHVVIEAMAIAGFAIGASQGYIYVRAEYPTAVERLNIAIGQAKEYGLLGDNIFGTDFSFNLELRLGAGAFVCGEETALMTSIEGNRGEPRPRPPFPAEKGLFMKPTILNNVETYANIPQIILDCHKFASMGTEKAKGTKVFALGGKINNTGLVEIPMGTPLSEVINTIGGGIPNGKKFKAAQTGGPSGGCIPAEHFDIPIDYDNLIGIGSMMGSGGLIVMDEDNCMVDIAKFFLEFTVDESCGKCTPCRIGTKRLYEILDKITKGQGTLEDLDKLEELCYYIKNNALCGLGQTAPNPVLSTLRYFRDEYIAHVVDKKCPAGVCKALLNYSIDPDKCKGCTACARKCPVGAISGNVKEAHIIDTNKCIKCGACMETCKFGAIEKK